MIGKDIRRIILALVLSCAPAAMARGDQGNAAAATTTAPAEAKKPSPPSPAELAASQKLIDQLFKDDLIAARTPEEKTAMAKKLLEQAEATADAPSDRYALLKLAGDTAADAGDVDLCLTAAGKIAEEYDVDPLETTEKSLIAVARSIRQSGAYAALIKNISQLIDQAFDAERYDVALAAAQLGQSAAARNGDSTAAQQFTLRSAEVRQAQNAYADAQRAAATLATKSDDPQANLTVGKYLCFTRGEWEHGLPLLAHGNDAKLKALAEKDLANPTDPGDQMAMGDAWWDSAVPDIGPIKKQKQNRAAFWYQLAMPKLTGLTKLKIEKRLEEAGGSERTIVAHGHFAVSPDDLTSHPWMLYWGAGGRLISLGPDGKITSGANDFESAYRLVNGKLEFLSRDGKVFARYTLNPDTGVWSYSLGQRDTISQTPEILRPILAIDLSTYLPTPEDQRVIELLQAGRWMLTWDGDGHRQIAFGPNGALTDGSNDFESQYRVMDGKLEFISSDHLLTSRFVWDESQGMWTYDGKAVDAINQIPMALHKQ